MRVVLADDSILLREGLVRLLAEEGHEVAAAVGDADQLIAVLEQAGEEGEKPDAVVVDVRMPPTHTDEGCAPPYRSGSAGPISASWCSRNMSSAAMRQSC